MAFFRVVHIITYKRGVKLTKNSKFIPGIGLERTERYSSLNKLLTAPFNDHSAHFVEKPLSRVILLMK